MLGLDCMHGKSPMSAQSSEEIINAAKGMLDVLLLQTLVKLDIGRLIYTQTLNLLLIEASR